jgi:hypothetical protein
LLIALPRFEQSARLCLPQGLLAVLALKRNGVADVGTGFLASGTQNVARLAQGVAA